ncbi:hypothetical protein GCM10023226_15350 [Nocardioides nanhaiensis]|uniref:DUF2946 domain-containing protein n=1 Tax=Nocardioides nanhaiensis TaxID=1476871 RepID=A0ABP8W304_9ACTN
MPSTAVSARRRALRALTTAGQGAGQGWLAALVAALVLGILGMHALASHGTPTAPAAASSAMSMPGMTAVHEAAMTFGDSHAARPHHASAAQLSDHSSAGSGSGHGMAGMVMLCVVMLAAAGLTLLAVLAAGLFRPLLPVAFMPAAVRARALQWVRGTGPPHEWQFSVIRC